MKPSITTRSQNISSSTLSRTPEILSPIGLVVAASCVVVIFAIVYAPSLNYQFILDDHRFTTDPRIQFSGHIWDYFTSFVWAQFTGGPPSFYRPIFLLWMRINFIFCDLSMWGWHLLSLIKHAAVTTLLAWLVWKLLRDRTAALLAAALFALHPAQTESVAWATVPDPLMALGVFGSLLLYLKYLDSRLPEDNKEIGRTKARKKAARSPSYGLLFAASSVCFLALGAKETAIVLPIVVFALALFIPQEPASNPVRNPSGNNSRFQARMRRAGIDMAPFAAATLLYLLLRFVALGNHLSSRTQHLPLTTVIFSWPATLWFYVKVMFWPARSHAFADSMVVDHFSAQDVLLPLLGILFAATGLTALIFWCRRVARSLPKEESTAISRALLIGAVLLIVPILAALDLNALNPGDFLHGRYTYLPLAGLMILLSTAWHLAGKAQLSLLILAAALTIACATLTSFQENQWQDDLSVYTTAHALAPNNRPVSQNLANAHIQQALQLGEQGRCSDAVPVFRQVINEYPNDWYAWAALGDCLVQLNDLPKAEESLHKAADLSHDPHVIEQWQELRAHMGLPSTPSSPK